MKSYTRVGTLLSASVLAAFLGACSDESSSSAPEVSPSSAEDVQLSSSSVAEVPGSSTDSAIAEGSSSSTESSSSMLEETSSSSETVILHVPEGGLFRWVGEDDGARIITGMDIGTETSGYWFSFADDADGGWSSMMWPIAPPTEFSEFFYIVEHCGGVCGTFSLKKGDLETDPFVGLGFNIAGENEDGSVTTADVSAWEGLCVAYYSTIDIKLELSYGDEFDSSVGYDLPFVTLKSTE